MVITAFCRGKTMRFLFFRDSERKSRRSSRKKDAGGPGRLMPLSGEPGKPLRQKTAGDSEQKGRQRNRRLSLPCLPENALFWVFLVLLSIGCITRLYEKAALSPASSGQIFSAGGQGRDYQVKDRKLPIYCVETEKPQVALSFDAAWGGARMRLCRAIYKQFIENPIIKINE